MKFTPGQKGIMLALFPLGPVVFFLFTLAGYILFNTFLGETFSTLALPENMPALIGGLLCGSLAALALNVLIWSQKPESAPDIVVYFPLIGLIVAGAVFYVVRAEFDLVMAFLISVLAAAAAGALLLFASARFIPQENTQENNTGEVY